MAKQDYLDARGNNDYRVQDIKILAGKISLLEERFERLKAEVGSWDQEPEVGPYNKDAKVGHKMDLTDYVERTIEAKVNRDPVYRVGLEVPKGY